MLPFLFEDVVGLGGAWCLDQADHTEDSVYRVNKEEKEKNSECFNAEFNGCAGHDKKVK